MKRCYKPLLAVLVFGVTAQNGTAQVQIGNSIHGESANDLSGSSVSMPDTLTVAIGAMNNSGNGSEAGHVRVYRLLNGSWVQKGDDIDGEAPGDKSGWSVDMPSSDMVAIGAHKNAGNGVDAGHVRVYRWNGSSWIQRGEDIEGDSTNDEFGRYVSMSDTNTIAIGAPGNLGTWGSNTGQVKVFRWDGSAWVQKGSSLYGDGSQNEFGHSISMIDSNTFAVGAPYDDNSVGNMTGQVRVFEWDGSDWAPKGSPILALSAIDFFGYAVSMPDVNTLAVGAPYGDGIVAHCGQVQVYDWDGTAWTMRGLPISGSAINDYFGSFVSMPNTNTLAVGAIFGHPPNIGNYYYGYTRVFKWDGNGWSQMGSDIYGNAKQSNYGSYVCMPDSITIAAGEYSVNNGRGLVKVHRFCNYDGIDVQTTCDSITWIDGQTYSENNQTATYAIAGGAMNGCDSTVTLNLTVTNVDVSVTNASPTLTSNATNATAYQWIDCTNENTPLSGANNASFTATSNGLYAVAVTQNNCTDTSECIAVTNASVGMHEYHINDNLNVYPNPSSGLLNLDLGKEYGAIHVQVSNLLGEVLISSAHHDVQTMELNLAGAYGVYILYVTTGNGEQFTTRVIKTKP